MAKATGPSFSEIMSKIKKGHFAPYYILHGEEDYFIDEIATFIEENALDESLRAFNQSIVYGRDVLVKDIRDLAMRLPMMAPRQVVIVREAQDVFDLKSLEPYFVKPIPTTLLVLCHKYKKIDGRSTFFKQTMEGGGIVFESKKLYDNQIPDWIKHWLKDHQYDISPEALALAHEYLGNQLSQITSQLAKIFSVLEKGSKIEIDLIRSTIGISREYNVFELQKALGNRQKERAFSILYQMMKDLKSNHPVAVISILSGYFTKIYTLHQLHGAKEDEIAKALGMSPFILRDYRTVAKMYSAIQLENIIGLLHDFDLRSKGIDHRHTENGEILRELLHGILAA